MTRSKTYTMDVTVTVTLPDNYEEHIDEYKESECEHACYSAVTQQFGIRGMNSKEVKGPGAKWLNCWAECDKAVFSEETE